MPTARRDLGVAAGADNRIYAVGGYDGSFLNVLEVFDSSTGVWTTGSSAPVGRNAMGFAFNPVNGRFYYGGGYHEGAFSEFYEYNPVIDTWTQRASMLGARYGHRFAAANGKIYAVGGTDQNGLTLAQVDAYDPTTDQWVATTSLPTPRNNVGLVTSPAGMILAIGGTAASGQSDVVEEYDPATGTWAQRAPMPTAREDLGVSVTATGRILAVGGGTAGTPYTPAVEEYDPVADTWTSTTPLPFGVYAPGVALGGDGRVYTIGGLAHGEGSAVRMTYGYATIDPTPDCTDQSPCWALSPFMPTPRRDLGVAADSNGRIYAAGGYDAAVVDPHEQNFSQALEVYDPATGSWTNRAPIPVGRNDMGFAFNPANGKFYIGGGYRGGVLLGDFYEYDPSNDSWTQKASLPSARVGLRFAAADGKIYAIGGGFLNGSFISHVEEYDPTTDTWLTKGQLPQPRQAMAVVNANGKIYAIGGSEFGPGLDRVDQYDPVTDTWTARAPMTTGRQDAAASLTADGTIVVIGGVDATGAQSATIEEYDPTTDTWIQRSPFPFAGYGVGAALGSDGHVHALGGHTTHGPVSNTHYSSGGASDLDLTPPVVTVNGVDHGAEYLTGYAPTASCTTTDAGSGVSTNATLTITDNGAGSFTATCDGAVDNAGNEAAPVSETYQVVAAVYTVAANVRSVSGNATISAVVTTPVPRGDTVTISVSPGTFNTTPVGCSDSKGNTYAIVADIVNGNGRAFVCASTVTAPLISGDTVTATYPAFSGVSVVSVNAIDSLATDGTVAAAATASANSAIPSTGSVTTTGTINVLFGAVVHNSVPTFTPGAGYALLGQVIGGSGASTKTLSPQYRIVTTAGSYTANGTLSSAQQWRAVIVVFNGA